MSWYEYYALRSWNDLFEYMELGITEIGFCRVHILHLIDKVKNYVAIWSETSYY